MPKINLCRIIYLCGLMIWIPSLACAGVLYMEIGDEDAGIAEGLGRGLYGDDFPGDGQLTWGGRFEYGRNIFLDGNTFSSSRSVDKENFVIDKVVDAALSYKASRIILTVADRSEEFTLQPGHDSLEKLSLSYQPGVLYEEKAGPTPPEQTEIPKEKKMLAVNAGGVLLIAAWGVVNWDYGTRSPHATAERWFSRNTKEGGADKLGHFHINYTLTHGLASLYEHWGYEQDRAVFWGGISSFGLMGFMEAGDSFSDYGFSYEDFLMNSLGSLAGYYFYLHPEISSKIDFRVEHDFDFSKADFFTDYEHQKYLLAVKLAGFDFIENGLLKYLELHLGYYTRGYDDTPSVDREQNLYVGIGINLSRIFEKMSCKKTAKVLQYIQVPYTYLMLKEDQN